MLLINFQVCFFRQFFRSVRRADYLTMRHGFVSVSNFHHATSVLCLHCCLFHLLIMPPSFLQVHLAPGSKFDFQKYIKRSLEDDFKVVVGIR